MIKPVYEPRRSSASSLIVRRAALCYDDAYEAAHRTVKLLNLCRARRIHATCRGRVQWYGARTREEHTEPSVARDAGCHDGGSGASSPATHRRQMRLYRSVSSVEPSMSVAKEIL